MRADVFEDLISLIGETIAEQDAVLLGRKMYEEWSVHWPQSTMEPFASFINHTPKFVMSNTLKTLDWRNSTLLSDSLVESVAALKGSAGGTVGVHGSISVVQSLLVTGLLDELRFVQFPVVVGHGRRLLSNDAEPIQLDLESARKTQSGLQYLVFRPRG